MKMFGCYLFKNFYQVLDTFLIGDKGKSMWNLEEKFFGCIVNGGGNFNDAYDRVSLLSSR